MHFWNPQGWAAILSYWAAVLVDYIKSQYFCINVRMLTHSAVVICEVCGPNLLRGGRPFFEVSLMGAKGFLI